MYSIVIPYLKNSKFIEQCKHYIEINSMVEHELVEIVDETDVYYAYNYGVYKAKHDKVILLNDDMIVSKGWDINFVKYIDQETIVTGYVIEPRPGPILKPDRTMFSNKKYDCGLSVDTFDYDKFQTFVDIQNVEEVKRECMGWYMPVGVHRKSYIGYPNIKKFPNSWNDILLLDHILPNCGYKFALVKSFVYHYQSGSKKD